MPIPRKPEDKEYKTFVTKLNTLCYGTGTALLADKLPVDISVNHLGQEMYNTYLDNISKEDERAFRAIPVRVVIDQHSPFVARGENYVVVV